MRFKHEHLRDPGTVRCGQEYVRPLLMLTGKEYLEIGFDNLLRQLEAALYARYGDRPMMIIRGTDGAEERIPMVRSEQLDD